MIVHHPSPDVLLDYARGALHVDLRLVVTCHLEFCGNCLQKVRVWEGVGAALLENLEPSPISEGARSSMWARLDEPVREHEAESEALPAYLAGYSLPQSLNRRKLSRRIWITPGVWIAPTPSIAESSRRSYLLFAKSGRLIPRHTHGGREFTFVIDGCFSDENGKFGPGDFAEMREGAAHEPAVARESDCLCYVSSDAPLLFKGWAARFLQWSLGARY
jgi:putative transcriptional regulator